MASGCRIFSTRSGSYRTRTCRWRPGRCAAGTGTTKHYFQLLQGLARHYGFDIDTPWAELPEAVRNRLLYGGEGRAIEFRYNDARGSAQRRRHDFEGIMPNLERRWRESDSGAVREELGRYRGTRPCPECNGSRLNQVARAVLIEGRSIAGYISSRSARRWPISVPCSSAADAPRSRTGSCARSANGSASWRTSRPGLYRSRSRRRFALGGETQRIRLASQVGSGLTGVMYILDEPSIGLHQRDDARLWARSSGCAIWATRSSLSSTDEEAIRTADHVVDLARRRHPRRRGGGAGRPEQIAANPQSLTGRYLAGVEQIAVPRAAP